MNVIKLNDMGTRAVLHRHGLSTGRRLGKGATCAVYEDGPDAVIKLTADPVQWESVRDYLGGVHFPTLVESIGHVGTQRAGDRELYMFKAERLRPIRDAEPATRKQARHLLKVVDRFWGSAEAKKALHQRGTIASRRSACSVVVLEQLAECPDLPQSMQEACVDLLRLVMDYQNLNIDFQERNLMVRGNGDIVFNDVVIDASLLWGNMC